MLTNLTLIKQAPGPTRQGGQTPGQLAGVDPRLVAGEARDGGGLRVYCSGNQMDGGDHLRDAGDPVRRVVQSVTPGATYIDGGELKGGGRSSGLSGNGVARHERAK